MALPLPPFVHGVEREIPRYLRLQLNTLHLHKNEEIIFKKKTGGEREGKIKSQKVGTWTDPDPNWAQLSQSELQEKYTEEKDYK